jgi:DeoR family transcriptional regulator of aga operon
MAIRKQTQTRRTEEIMQDLLRVGDISVNEMAEHLNVSSTTVRRCLRKLEAQGLLRRRHGGAVPVETSLYEGFRYDADFNVRDQLLADEKRRIGLTASMEIKDGDVVAFSAGTTTTQVARALKLRKDVTVVTNALNIAMELARSNTIRVLLAGGYVSGSWFSVLGPVAIETIAGTEIDIAFIGADGIDIATGVTADHPGEADVNAMIIRRSRRRIVVADHTKLGKRSAALICPLHAVDMIVTDSGISDEVAGLFLARKTVLVKA